MSAIATLKYFKTWVIIIALCQSTKKKNDGTLKQRKDFIASHLDVLRDSSRFPDEPKDYLRGRLRIWLKPIVTRQKWIILLKKSLHEKRKKLKKSLFCFEAILWNYRGFQRRQIKFLGHPLLNLVTRLEKLSMHAYLRCSRSMNST